MGPERSSDLTNLIIWLLFSRKFHSECIREDELRGYSRGGAFVSRTSFHRTQPTKPPLLRLARKHEYVTHTSGLRTGIAAKRSSANPLPKNVHQNNAPLHGCTESN